MYTNYNQRLSISNYIWQLHKLANYIIFNYNIVKATAYIEGNYIYPFKCLSNRLISTYREVKSFKRVEQRNLKITIKFLLENVIYPKWIFNGKCFYNKFVNQLRLFVTFYELCNENFAACWDLRCIGKLSLPWVYRV